MSTSKIYRVEGRAFRVNDADYGDSIVVECLIESRGVIVDGYVPAWEECGFAELCGPFVTVEAAETACALLEALFAPLPKPARIP